MGNQLSAHPDSHSSRTPTAQVPVLNFRDFISANGEVLTTTSLKAASVFKKDHSKVCTKIKALIVELGSDHAAYFGDMIISTDIGKGGTRQDAAYCMTRDGFVLLVMGFTGKKAFAFKVAYIKAFNAMAAYIKNQRDGLRYRCMEKELECKDSARRGSIHGKGLNLRKQEKPVLESELAHLLDQAQRPLNLKAPE